MAETKINASQTTITAEDIGAAGAVATLPTASASEEGKIYQFTGTTTASYTNGYFYKCVSDGAVTPTYSWTQVNVQPAGGGSSLPSQTGHSGEFLTTDGTDASWATINALQNTGASIYALAIDTPDVAFTNVYVGNNQTRPNAGYGENTLLGSGCRASNNGGTGIGRVAQAGYNSIALGKYANASTERTIQLGWGTNSESGTMCVALENSSYVTTNYKLLDSNGTIPADRLASTTGLADGNYRLRLTVASGVPTLSWVAE